MNAKIALCLAMTILAAGCASNKMNISADQTSIETPPDKAQVIFMRPSSFGGAVQASVFDVTAGDPEFIGIISTGTQVSLLVDPGKHTFMVVSEAADFLEADLSSGKTYYTIVSARFGAWKARFSLYPVRNGAQGDFEYKSEQFQGWMKKVRFVENTPESHAWFEANKAGIVEKQARYWTVWQQKSAGDLAERTLNPDDGV
jgi:hypothetical protein